MAHDPVRLSRGRRYPGRGFGRPDHTVWFRRLRSDRFRTECGWPPPCGTGRPRSGSELDRQFPGIAGAIVHREMSTSETFQHYLNTPGGSLYGFAPESRGFMPLAATAINGLYLAPAFTGGGGFTGAILGGGWAARAACERTPE